MPCAFPPLPLPLALLESSRTRSPNSKTSHCRGAASSHEGIIEIRGLSLRDLIERLPLTIRLLGERGPPDSPASSLRWTRNVTTPRAMPPWHGQRGWLTREGYRRELLAFPCHRGAGTTARGLFVGQPLEQQQGLRGRGGATQSTAPLAPPFGCVRSPSSYSTAVA
jgi:hypothetical protein